MNTTPVAETITPGAKAAPRRRRRWRSSRRGQVLIIAGGVLIPLIALVGLVIDLGWYQTNVLRVQRAADAAALAGVVYLPGQVGTSYTTAEAEATKNGYSDGGGTVVTPVQDAGNARRLNVTITTNVDTFFARIIGVNTLPISRVASAEYVRPVPMGSPLNYYGIGCMDMAAAASDPQCITSGNSNAASGVPSASTGSTLIGASAPSQLSSGGFWGAAFTKGGDSRNGDAYLPTMVSSPNISNSEYDPSGYGYTVEVPAGGGGRVYIFDAGFCGMPVLGSGRAGTGDEWTTNMNGTNPQPVSTYFNLYNQNGSPFLLTDDTLVFTTGSRFENMKQNDKSGLLGSGQPQYDTDSTVTRCDRSTDSNYQYHLKWWQLPVTLPAGQYRLQVTTTKMVTASGGGTVVLDPNVNSAVGAANRFGLQVTSSAGSPRVYGGGRMAAYANVQSGRQTFYLAQIDRASGAGKTVEIDLYDPGDVGGGAWLEILNPDGNTYTPATFSFTSVSKNGVAGESGTNVTCIETNYPTAAPPGGVPSGCPASFNGSGSHFDAYWLKIIIPLPSTYGTSGLTPSGEPQPGWWKIRYTVGGGNDTTTWQVTIRGNPVHLVPQ
ncbi:MAG TPA: pilus assembly protein TadG-related protein [Candidatus Limnocylindria bacterium]